MPARNWMSHFLLRKLHSNAIFVSLYWTRGKNINLFFLNKNWRQQRRRKLQQRRRRQLEFFDLRFFYVKILFRAMFLFSSLRILSTKVICKAATELLKFQRRLTRRTKDMLIMRHTRLWTENCIFLEENLIQKRYFSFCLRFRKITV